MKKIYTLLLAMTFAAAGFAQSSYFMLPGINAGFNPGNLNDDPEQPAEPGWTDIMTTTSTDQWSSVQSIPFNFEFDGSVVSNFYVSNTGVLTFNSSPGTAPSDQNAVLPSSSIPNQSVCAWGMNLEGSNDKIRSKVFGTAPNRQLWVMWASASAPELTGSASWTYWSIVLEETSNSIYVVDQRTYDGNGATPTGNNVGLTVGIQVSLTNFISTNSSPNTISNTISTGGNGSDQTDNSFYEFLPGTQKNYDLTAVSRDVADVVETNKGVFISGLFRNLGNTTVNTADFNYRVNGGATVTAASVGNLPLATGDYKTLSSPTKWTPSADGFYTIEAWISNLNGAADENKSNDTIRFQVAATSAPPQKKVVLEERTGTWCGWCPRGAVAMEHMGLNYHDDATLIAVHNSDPMAISSYDSRLSGAFPTFTEDRVNAGISLSQNSMVSAVTSQMGVVPNVGINIKSMNYNSATGNISIDVESTFLLNNSNADYRYNVVLTENGVKGTSSGYAQVNYYAGGAQGPMVTAGGFDYSTAPDPVPASQMVYDHVAISLSPNFDGNAGDIPSNISFNQTVNTTLTTTLPASAQNEDHVYVNVILLDANDGGRAINSDHMKLTTNVSLDENDLIKANLYPNPAKDVLNVELFEQTDFSVEIVNAVGQVVLVDSFEKTDRARINTSNLKAGMYLVNIVAGSEKSTFNVVINH